MQNYSEKYLILLTKILGAEKTGKTSVFLSFLEKKPLVFDESLVINDQDLYIDQQASLRLLDYTQLAESARHVRTDNTAIFILVFDINDYKSFAYIKKEITEIQSKIDNSKLIGTDYSFVLVANNKPLATDTQKVSQHEILELCKQLECKFFSVTANNHETLHELHSETMQLAKSHATKIRESILQQQIDRKIEAQEKRRANIKAKLQPYAHFILNLLINICLIIFAVFTIAWCLYNWSQNKEPIYAENSRVRGNFFKFLGDTVEVNESNQQAFEDCMLGI